MITECFACLTISSICIDANLSSFSKNLCFKSRIAIKIRFFSIKMWMWSELAELSETTKVESEKKKNLYRFKCDYFHLYPKAKVNLNPHFKADVLKMFFSRPHLCQLFHLWWVCIPTYEHESVQSRKGKAFFATSFTTAGTVSLFSIFRYWLLLLCKL